MNGAVIGAGDRFSLTLFVSLAVHALVILGIGFTWQSAPEARKPPMIEVTLASEPQSTPPEDYDFLAQANQDGGGTSEEAGIPEKRQKSLTPGVPEGRQAVASAPPPAKEASEESLTAISGAAEAAQREPEPAPEPPEEEPSKAEAMVHDEPALAAQDEPVDPMARLDARYPSKRRISARTKEHDAAAYMRQWIQRVEEIGNLNYPSEARVRELTGRLILEVTLRPDGSIYATKVLRGSAHPVLDQAAMRIVDIAGPFPEIPAEVLKDDDLLVITRTWEFRDNQRLNTQ